MAKLWKQHAAGSGETDSPTLSHMALLSSPLCKCLQIKTGPLMAEVRTGVTSSFERDRKQSEMPPSHCLSLDGFKIKTAKLFTTSRALMRARALDSKRGAAGRVWGCEDQRLSVRHPGGEQTAEAEAGQRPPGADGQCQTRDRAWGGCTPESQGDTGSAQAEPERPQGLPPSHTRTQETRKLRR